MKKAPRFGMKAGSESLFFLYSSCSRRRRSPSVSVRDDGALAAGAASATATPVSKSTVSASTSASLASWPIVSPFIIISVSFRAEKAASERAMGGEGWRLLAFGRGFASRAPFAFRLGLPCVSEGALSASLRSLLSASASSSTSLSSDASLCESSASVATDWLSSSSSVRLRRAMLVVLLRAGAMIAG
jgi:hypothetical protein